MTTMSAMTMMNMGVEPLLTPSKFQFFSGIRFEKLEECCIIQEKSRWTSEEIVLTEDTAKWNDLDSKTQLFIKHVLSFSIVSDHLVNCNILDRFLQEVTDPSSRRFYLFQAYMEDVHRRTYGNMLTAVILDREELERLINPDVNIPSIDAKIKWIKKWTNSDASFGQRLIAFAIIEGVFFSSLFCAFFWLKQRGTTLPGMIKANEFISRDEKMHCEFAIEQLKYVNNKLPMQVIQEMMQEAVTIEKSFVDEALPVDLLGINKDTMMDYVKYIADRWLQMIPCIEGYCLPIFNIKKQPLEWMENISVQTFASFFEVEPTNYVDPEFGHSNADKEFSTDLSIFN